MNRELPFAAEEDLVADHVSGATILVARRGRQVNHELLRELGVRLADLRPKDEGSARPEPTDEDEPALSLDTRRGPARTAKRPGPGEESGSSSREE